jgi:hypothetical protein
MDLEALESRKQKWLVILLLGYTRALRLDFAGTFNVKHLRITEQELKQYLF